ncbi:hypothetical protein [Paraburkholderia sp. Tr-20389]|nr:hypothetical protein [Paraburkholderia sp. Tr-20389]
MSLRTGRFLVRGRVSRPFAVLRKKSATVEAVARNVSMIPTA